MEKEHVSAEDHLQGNRGSLGPLTTQEKKGERNKEMHKRSAKGIIQDSRFVH